MSNKLTTNFSIHEFECKCGCVMPAFALDNIKELATNLQVIRDEVGPLYMTNAYRCKPHNRDVGSSDTSQHPLGKATDLKTKKYTARELSVIIEDLIKSEKIKEGGLGIYNTFTHYDTRGVRAIWSKTTKK